MMETPVIEDINVEADMRFPGPYPMYTCDQFGTSPDCKVDCKYPSNIIFTLSTASIDDGWHFAGYSPNTSAPMPLHANLGFSSVYPNQSLTIFNPAIVKGDIHRFSLYYTNKKYNDGAPFSFDPETENKGGSGV